MNSIRAQKEAMVLTLVFAFFYFGCSRGPSQSGESQSSKLGGVGLLLSFTNGYPIVVEILDDSPARSCPDMHVGSVLLSVSKNGDNDEFISLRDRSRDDIWRLIRGEIGSKFKLKVSQKSNGPPPVQIVELTRSALASPGAKVARSTKYHYDTNAIVKWLGTTNIQDFERQLFEAFDQAEVRAKNEY